MPDRDLDGIAAEINALFWEYGLDHEVVSVDSLGWDDRLVFLDSADVGKMDLLLETISYVFQGYFEHHPKRPQQRLF